MSTGNFSSFLSQWYQKPLFNSLRKHPQFQELKQRRLANNPLELAKSLLHMGTGSQPSLWHQLPNLSNDLLLLVGEGDNKFKEINTEMAIICKNAKLEIIRNCGHNIHICNVNQFVNHLRQFFNP